MVKIAATLLDDAVVTSTAQWRTQCTARWVTGACLHEGGELPVAEFTVVPSGRRLPVEIVITA